MPHDAGGTGPASMHPTARDSFLHTRRRPRYWRHRRRRASLRRSTGSNGERAGLASLITTIDVDGDVDGVEASSADAGGAQLGADTVRRMSEYLILALSLDDALASRAQEAEDLIVRLVNIVAEKAPSALDDNTGVALQRELLSLARLAAFTSAEEFLRTPESWQPDDDPARASSSATASLCTHLLEEYETPIALRAALSFTDATGDAGFYGLGQGHRCSEEASRVSWAFFKAYKSVARGGSARDAMREHVSPALTKKMVASFIAGEYNEYYDVEALLATLSEDEGDRATSPLHALRVAQLRCFGADDWVVAPVLASRAGSALASDDIEAFVQSAMQWIALHQDALSEPQFVRMCLDYMVEMRRADASYDCFGRTPKTVLEALEAYQLSTLTFDDDEEFERNPVGIRGMFDERTDIPAGTQVRVPYEGITVFNEGVGPMTVRVAEILSLKRLIYEGQQLGNCLQDNRYAPNSALQISTHATLLVPFPRP